MNKVSIAAAIIGLFLNIHSVEAETFSYPAESPVFSITFPDNWKIETEEDLLHAAPADESIYVGLWAMEGIENIENALEALDKEIEDIIQDIEAGEPMETEINGIPFIIIEGRGKIEDDISVDLSVSVFSTDGETFFIGLYFGTPDMIKKHSVELKAAIQSVKALE